MQNRDASISNRDIAIGDGRGETRVRPDSVPAMANTLANEAKP